MRPLVLGLLGLLLVTTGTESQSPDPYTVCGGDITGSSGEIWSHAGYGTSEYENNLNCEYSITLNPRKSRSVHPRKSIRVEFMSMDLEADRSCAYDKVMVIADGVEQGPFCGTNLPPVMSSASNELVIRWTSDDRGTGPGWALRWTGQMVETAKPCQFSNGYNYTYVETLYGWDDARANCMDLGGDIAYHGFDNMTFREEVACDHFNLCNNGIVEYPWFGLKKVSESPARWEYLDDSVSPDGDTWHPGQYDQVGHDCGRFYHVEEGNFLRTWSNPCDWTLASICEYRC